MYGYVFDSFVQDKRFRTESNRIETRLVTLGIQGRQEKITILKNIVEATKAMIKRGVETLVVVGNDQTILKVLRLVVEQEIPLGIIPVGPDQRVAAALGIPSGAAACDVLSRRVMRRIDLGRAGPAVFLLVADIPAGAGVRCDDAYTITALDPAAQMSILNMPDSNEVHHVPGRLTLVVGGSRNRGWSGWKSKRETSIFPLRSAQITTPRSGATIVLDGQTVVKTPITVTVEPKRLNVIVGPGRNFS